MKKYSYLKVIAVACVSALASCGISSKTAQMPVAATPRPDSSVTGGVLQAVNSYRRDHGASDLVRHAGLDRLAQEHSEYLMAHRGTFSLSGKNVSHIGFEGRTLIARERFQMVSISENVLATSHLGKNPAPTLVKLWSESKDHEYNMRSSWTHTGIGLVVDSDGMAICTQLFATINYSHLASRQRFSGF